MSFYIFTISVNSITKKLVYEFLNGFLNEYFDQKYHIFNLLLAASTTHYILSILHGVR